MTQWQYEIKNDTLYTYLIEVDEQGKKWLLRDRKEVMPKDVFIKCYNQWIRKKPDKPLYYFVDEKRVLANTEPVPNFADYYSRDTGYSEESYNKYIEAWNKHIESSIIIADFYTEAVAQRVCDELIARRILEE